MRGIRRKLIVICLCIILFAVFSLLRYRKSSKDNDTKGKQTQSNQVSNDQTEDSASDESTMPDKHSVPDESTTPDENTTSGKNTNSASANNKESSESPTTSTDKKPTSDTEVTNVLNEVPDTREALNQLPAETILNISKVEDIAMDTYFYYEEISENVFNKIKGKSYGEDCTVPRKDLRYIRVLHYGFDEKTHIGELIVNKAIAKDIVEIFKELYEAKYPIEKMVLIDAYDADDNTSMADNNTSSFNFRPVPGGSHLSKHALGLAIDINPLYNPYVQYMKDKTVILPVEGSKYADRSLDNPYYIRENDVLFKAFTKRGFSWGGFWKTEPDYQHFVKKID